MFPQYMSGPVAATFFVMFSQFILIKLAELTASTECNVKLGRFMKINPISTNLLDSSKRPTLWSVTGAS